MAPLPGARAKEDAAMKSKMSNLLLPLFMLIILPVACSTPAEMEGTWLGHEIGSPQQNWTMTIEGSQFKLVCENTGVWYKGNLVLNTNCSRNKMDLRIRATAVQAYNGKTSLGIYEIEDGSLILVATEPGKTQRPFSFDETEEFIAFVFEKSAAD